LIKLRFYIPLNTK